MTPMFAPTNRAPTMTMTAQLLEAVRSGMTENRRTPQNTFNNNQKVLKTVKL